MMNRWIFGVAMVAVSAMLATGCCKSGSEDEGAGAPAAEGDKSGAADEGSGETLTGEEGVKRLEAKGWQPLTDPVVNDAGPAKTTTFISKPDGITVNFIEYKEETIAKMAREGMKSDMYFTALYGRTLVQVVCPTGKPREKCQKALDDIKS